MPLVICGLSQLRDSGQLNGQSYFQLISPLIFLVFSLGFWGVFYISRDQKSARDFALSYCCGAIGFLFDFFRDVYPGAYNHMPSNVAYMLTAAFFASALTRRYLGRVHAVRIGTLFGLSCATSAFFTFVIDDIVMRTFAVNLFAMILFGYPLPALYHIKMRAIDKTIYVLVAITALQFPIRTSLVLWIEGATLTSETYAGSLAALSLQFATSVAALFTAMALFLMFGMDIMVGLRKTSETDLLTGLRNRRGLEAARPAFEQALLDGVKSHAVLIADIDHFKAVNDTYGHDVGDIVLTRCARALEKLETDKSVVARVGGEEFYIVLHNTDLAAARLAGEYACSVVKMIEHPEMANKQITISIGIALFEEPTMFTDSFRRADQALYRAKSNGRDQVRVAEVDTPNPQSENITPINRRLSQI